MPLPWSNTELAGSKYNDVSNDDEDYLKMIDEFAAIDKRRTTQYAG